MNVGTTFYIYLPALPAVVPQPKPDVEPSADLPYGRGQTILIVEDNDNLRAALITSLQSLHYQVEAVANGQEALDTLNQPDHSVALILSDVIMPNMGGLDLLRALRQQGNHIPLILLTGHAMHSDITDLKRQGVKDILFKPPGILSLAQALAKAFAD
ncbi:MAG: response regulator [bacterium]|nr:response regulator [bacterium]